MSKIIKASQIIGKYKIQNQDNALSIESLREKAAQTNQSTNGNNKKQNYSSDSSKKAHLIIKREKAEKEADLIIAQAEHKASEMIKAAEKEKKKIEAEKEEIFSKIKNEAEAEAIKAAQQKIDSAASELLLTAESFQAELNQQKIGVKKDIVRLAVKIASVIIDVKLEQQPEIINNIISDILSEIDESHKNIIVRIHPDLVPFIEDNNLYSRLKEKNLEFKADSDLKKGDCIVESNLGGKEGSISHKIDLIKEELLKEVEANV
ncbi:similar to Flagellar biosynthesis/type III secretory pathway protein [Halanaerobium saccharolyticum subsp. saccharolyticum DSM 6643]|uniref:Similar to Flagellar biosynthesis/type III secretory pathway protein n=1 Tax=Halanaerobium saccharolyticum subsp. saccharolyticum DSM 6643 TaxID=1293054 RepID=M5E3J9_9FIRM|nr:FliH/SctL family protein [Halanaerobium saccharolyticum]CCU80788.1 similar to Flagellar biosynthesis/type III secretory pathway protein [Halanaerobium saccharolyticum subsp. saccharolyticum DSM 6643]